MAEDSRCLLFVNRRVDATELAEKLASDGFGAAPFSGGPAAGAAHADTQRVQERHLQHPRVDRRRRRGASTCPKSRTVVHIDPPRTPDAYIHRSGRTGRAGRTGRSLLLVAGPETRRVTRLLRAARDRGVLAAGSAAGEGREGAPQTGPPQDARASRGIRTDRSRDDLREAASRGEGPDASRSRRCCSWRFPSRHTSQ